MTGFEVLRDPLANKETAFTLAERERLELTGLLPARAETIEEQVACALANLRAKPTPLEKFVYLARVRDANETLFFRA
jgi:hypothetical protein